MSRGRATRFVSMQVRDAKKSYSCLLRRRHHLRPPAPPYPLSSPPWAPWFVLSPPGTNEHDDQQAANANLLLPCPALPLLEGRRSSSSVLSRSSTSRAYALHESKTSFGKRNVFASLVAAGPENMTQQTMEFCYDDNLIVDFVIIGL